MEKGELNIPFKCPLHPKEEIKRLCTSSYCNSLLLCIECVLSSHDQSHTQSLESILPFIQKTTKYLNSIRRVRSDKRTPPQFISDLLKSESQTIEQVLAQTQKKKELIEETFNTIINSIISTCDKLKVELFKQLEQQIPLLHKTFASLSKEVEKFYNLSDEDEAECFSDDIIISQLNAASNYERFEEILSDLKSEVIKNQALKNCDNKVAFIEEIIRQKSEFLRFRLETFLTQDFILDSKSQSEIQKSVEEKFQDLTSKLFNTSSIFTELNLNSLDSNIITSSSDLMYLLQLPGSQGRPLKLVFRSSRDGMDAVKFRAACDKIKPSVILIKTDFGKIIGGYNDTDWIATNAAKSSTENYLFSVTDKKMMKIKNTKAATHGCNCCLVNFGSGEFCVKTGGTGTLNLNNVNYDTTGCSVKQLTGCDSNSGWKAVEFEAFQVCGGFQK